MSSRKTIAALAAAVVLLLSAPAAAEPPSVALDRPTRVKSPSTLRTDAGTERRLPPGTFLPAPVAERIEAELVDLQDARTRLEAENKSLRESASDVGGWGGYAVIAGLAFAAGIAAGYATFK